jgi:glycosyltransferase involved in cell wall biosynthesis
MKRFVLIVTPFFAPQNHAAVFRAYKLAKYLPRFGWTPIVLTAGSQYEYNEDAASLSELPPEVEVVRTRYIEPTLRGMRMALGGSDRTFRGTKGDGASGNANGAPTSFVKRAYQSAVKSYLQIPDAYWTWANTAIAAGRKLIRDRKIDIVYTSCAPYSSLTIGRSLQKAGAPWVADFRDPLGYSSKTPNGSYLENRQSRIVREALRHANAVTVLSSSYDGIFRRLFGNTHASPIFIPTGIDEDLLKPGGSNACRTNPYLVFAGEYLPEYDTSFLEAFAQAIGQQEIRETKIKLLVIGTLEINQKRLAPLIEKFGLQRWIEFVDQMPQNKVYELLRDARAGVLIPGVQSFWWANFAKMTDYIGMRKPVLAVVPDPSEARTALTRSRLGIFLDGTPAQRARRLSDFLLGNHAVAFPDDLECQRYTAYRQVQSFVEVFESLTAQSPRRKR